VDDSERVITETITKLAAANGEPNPHDIAYVTTTLKQAAQVLSAHVVFDDPEVYAVVAQGTFTGQMVKGRRRNRLPTGHHLLAAIDTATGEIRSWGINETPLDLARLGTPVALPAD
jgi:hypothetical protein